MPSSTRPFVVTFPTLEEGESRHELVGSAGDLGLAADEAAVVGPIVVEVDLYRRGQKVEVQGEVRALIDVSCDLCLAPVRLPLRAPLRVFADRRESRDRRPVEEVREDDLGMVYHDGRSIDLTEEVRQGLLLELPWHVRCSRECRGLCPRCGANRNEGSCRCPDAAAPPAGSVQN